MNESARKKVLVGTAVWNEGEKFARFAERMARFLEERRHDPEAAYEFLVIDDGSEDGVPESLKPRYSFLWVRHEVNQGAGAAVRAIYREAAARGCEVAVTIAGHGKDDPWEIPKLVEPILKGECDLVQGSRYLPGGGYQGMPRYRVLATRFVHPLLMSWFTGVKVTDSTNGFRALRVSILEDPRIRLDQPWLNRYELEPYLLYQALALGYRVKEVPVKKVYPDLKSGYTKMTPLIGWWSILRPLFLLKLGIKK